MGRQKDTLTLPLWESCESGASVVEVIAPATNELARRLDLGRKWAALIAKNFSRDEAKILVAGFTVVYWNRSEKIIRFAEYQDGKARWQSHPGAPFATYAQGERQLKLALQELSLIEVCENGTAMSGSWHKLYAAGFDFYRAEGIIQGHGTPRIKQGSKNWGTWEKYGSAEECQAGWDALMQTEKALQG